MSALQWLACRGRVATAASSLPLGRRAAWVLSVRPRGLTAQQALPQDGVERGATAVATAAVATRAEWGPDSRRCGALAVKVGMMSLFDGYGARVGVTVLTLDDLQVVQVKSPPKDDVLALQVGMGSKRRHRLAKAARNHFEAAGIEPKYKLAEFSVTPDCLMPVGTVISARHFVPGQYVDIKGLSKGKGTTGVMKRWGFKGGRRSHGATKHHRKGGSIGSVGPARVLKGKKMAGRSGATKVTAFNLQVYKVDVQRNLVYLRGCVPGPQGGIVRVTDSRKASTCEQMGSMYDLPVPTWLPEDDATTEQEKKEDVSGQSPQEILMPLGAVDPLKLT